MSSVELDIAAEMIEVFRQVHGEIPFTLDFVMEIVGPPDCTTFGFCDFSRVPPAIAIRTGLGETDLIDSLCHELAHLVSGYAADHNESWEKRRDELSVRYWARRIRA